MVELAVYLDVATSGRVMAHLLDPPGLGLRFPSRTTMTHQLPEELLQHLTWLRSHGEPVPVDVAPSYRVVEEVAIAGDFETGDVGFYSPDAAPVSPPEIDRYLRIAGHAHSDLLTIVQGLPKEPLHWVRDSRTRSIRNIVRHVVGTEIPSSQPGIRATHASRRYGSRTVSLGALHFANILQMREPELADAWE